MASWLVVCATGLAFGFVFRVPAVLAMGLVLFAGALVACLAQGAGWGEAALSGLILVALFEAAYLAGLLLAAVRRRKG